MLGIQRVLIIANDFPFSAADMSYSDTDSDSDMSVYNDIPDTCPVNDFVVLIVKGNDAVKQFEHDYPTHHSRCQLAKRIDRGHRFTEPVPYEITLHEYETWRIGAGFDSFMLEFVPTSLRPHICAYNVSDWDMFDYSETEMPPNSAANTASESNSPVSVQSWIPDAKQSDPSLLIGSRRASAPSAPQANSMKPLPFNRIASQQCSPQHKPRILNHLPVPATLQLASNSANPMIQ